MAKLLKSPDGNIVEFEAEIKAQTDLAIQVDFGGNEFAWIPRSQIEDIENDGGVLSTIYVPEWLAMEKGII